MVSFRLNRILGLDSVAIGTLLIVASAIAFYVHHSVSQVRQLLPVEVQQQQRDISSLTHAMGELSHSLELVRNGGGRPALEHSLEDLERIHALLDNMRREYTFDSLVGASAAHAVVNPAVEDIERWLRRGIPGHAAESAVVLRLALLRAQETHDQMHAVELTSQGHAASLLRTEVERLRQIRDSLMALVLAFAALTLVIVVLYIRRRNVQQQYATERGRLSDAIESAGSAVALFDSQQRLVVSNHQFRTLHGLSAAAVQSRPSIRDIVGRAIGSQRLVRLDDSAKGLEEEYAARRRHPGQPFQVQWGDGRHFQVCEHTTHEGGTISFITDITDLKQAQMRLEHLATHDALTGLPGRRRFDAAMQAAIHRAERHGRQLAVMFVDVDRLKWINDTYGHLVGDHFLQSVSKRLRATLRDHDPAARLGSDEFAIVLEDVASLEEVTVTGERLQHALSQPVLLEGGTVQTTVSIGIALYPVNGEDGGSLLKRANDACDQAKAGGRAGMRYFSSDGDEAAARRAVIEHRLRLALQHNVLQVYYQPQISMETRHTVGLEALLRWQDDTLGWVGPSEFVPIAEESGLGRSLLQHTTFEVFRQISEWNARGIKPGRTWLNVSPRQLPDLGATLASAFERYRLDPMLLGIEITERSLVDDPQHAHQVLAAIKAQGVSLAIDDFGVGYSSLSALRDYPLDELKIDASFVQHLCDEGHDVEIVRAIVTMARSLKLQVVAEGVETQEQLDVLDAENVRTVQGNLTGAPVPASQVERYLH